MGGREHLEELIFNENYNKVLKTILNRPPKMQVTIVTEYGMSERKLGPINVGGQGEVFVGRDYSQVQDISEATSQL